MFDVVNIAGRDRLELVLDADETVDPVIWGMLSHNTIAGVAQVERTGVDGMSRLAYDVTGYVPLRVVMDRTLRREETFRLISSLLDTVTEAGRYMIDAEWFSLQPDSVYVDPESLAVRLVCVPVAGRSGGDVLMLLKHIVLNLRHDRSESTAYLGDLVAMLNDPAGHDLARLTRTVRARSLNSRPVMPATQTAHDPVPQQAPVHPPVEASLPVGAPAATRRSRSRGGAVAAALGAPGEKPMSLLYLLQHYTKENRETYDRQKRERREAAAAAQHEAVTTSAAPGHPTAQAGVTAAYPAADVAAALVSGGEPFGHTIHVSALQAARDGGQHAGAAVATPLAVQPDVAGGVPAAGVGPAQGSAGPTAAPAVRRGLLTVLATGERVWIDSALFRIGRRRARVDLAVSGDTVSKVHATIHQQEPETWSIIDNGSTNGVEIDDVRIDPLVPVVLRPGQRIRIGEQVLMFEVATV